MKVDKVFKNGKIVTPNYTFYGGIAVEAGKIAAIGVDNSLPDGDIVVDLEGKTVMPGIIDNHVHFGSSVGDPDREDYVSGTKAAAASGITMISDMPTGVPGVLNADLFEEKISMAENTHISISHFTGALDPIIMMHFRGWLMPVASPLKHTW